MTAVADHDAYIAAAPEPFQPALRRLRAILARALPEAEEFVAYNMPGSRIGGTVVADTRRSGDSAGCTSLQAPSPSTL
jgi:uncharacterized protein YdhG (YjbR/CyaY superfamily)